MLEKAFFAVHHFVSYFFVAVITKSKCLITPRKKSPLLAFAGSKFVNRLKPLLAQGFSRVAIVVVLLQILALFGHMDDPWWWLYLQ